MMCETYLPPPPPEALDHPLMVLLSSCLCMQEDDGVSAPTTPQAPGGGGYKGKGPLVPPPSTGIEPAPEPDLIQAHEAGLRAESLRRAAGRGDAEGVRALLEDSARPVAINAMDIHHNSALLLAAAKGHEPVVRLLIDHGVDVNACRPLTNETPLMVAAYKGHSGVVQMLLAAGCDVTPRHVGGYRSNKNAEQLAKTEAIKDLIRVRA
jgi:hypothetical protein